MRPKMTSANVLTVAPDSASDTTSAITPEAIQITPLIPSYWTTRHAFMAPP
jgi:hypothetical protein